MKDNSDIIDHMGFVVEDARETVKKYEELFGVEGSIREYDKEQVVLGTVKVNGIKFVFNEPMTDDTRWAEFLREKGEGLEHICFSNFDFDEMVGKAKSKGFHLTHDTHKDVGGRRANFVTEEDMHVAKIEFIEPSDSDKVE
jgi:methylmalonyl-CoA/ethylmalonyl-CoA epimerase